MRREVPAACFRMIWPEQALSVYDDALKVHSIQPTSKEPVPVSWVNIKRLEGFKTAPLLVKKLALLTGFAQRNGQTCWRKHVSLNQHPVLLSARFAHPCSPVQLGFFEPKALEPVLQTLQLCNIYQPAADKIGGVARVCC